MTDLAGTNRAVVTPAPPPVDGLPLPRRYWSAIAIWAVMTICVLDGSIANIALPTIARDLRTSPAASIWVVNAYQIAIAMTLLSMAALGEIVSYRNAHLGGLAVFLIGSALCTLATDLNMLVVARFIQGFGAAAIMAVGGALVRFTYPRAHLGRGVGLNALVVALSTATGPVIAAALLTLGSWRILFLVNLPIGIVAFAMGVWALPRHAGVARRFDHLSALYNAIAFGGLFLGAATLSAGRPGLPGAFALAVSLVSFIALFRRARTQAAPLVPIDLLGVESLRLSYVASACSFAAQAMALIALPFYFQQRLGFGQVETGLMITPWPLTVIVVAPIAGRLTERIAPGTMGGIGLAVLTVGLLSLGLIAPGAPKIFTVVALSLCGGGFTFFQTPNNRMMLGLASVERSGAAAGMLATARMIGLTTGAVLVALLFRVSSTTSKTPFFVASGFAVAAALVSLGRRQARWEAV